MKKILILLSFILAQSVLASSPNATERFNSLLPFGSFDGDDCRVSVSRTLRGNIKVSVGNLLQRMHFVIPRHGPYRYVEGKHFAIKTIKRAGIEREMNYLFLSYASNGVSVLVGKSFYAPGASYDRNVECTLY